MRPPSVRMRPDAGIGPCWVRASPCLCVGGGACTRPPVPGLRCAAGVISRPARAIESLWRKNAPSSVTASPCHLPPGGGKALGAALEAAPTGCLRSLRRGAHCAPASRPAGRNPLGAILRLGWEEEDPSSVAACAVTPSPWRGEGFSGGWKPPLRDAFGQFVGAHIVRPPSLWARPDGVSGPMRYGLFPVTP